MHDRINGLKDLNKFLAIKNAKFWVREATKEQMIQVESKGNRLVVMVMMIKMITD